MRERGEDNGGMQAEGADACARRCIGLLACPVCGAPLERASQALRCPAGHAFDIARQGYVDLLPPGHGRSKRTGDTAEMIQARAAFLARGHYRFLADAVTAAVTAHFAGTPARAEGPATILDVGCGSGYYIGEIARRLLTEEPARPLCAFGLDLSTAAVRFASRMWRDVFFFVNDATHRITIADAAVDVLLNVFAPRNAAEFARVVRPGGTLIVVVPSERHLRELRTRLPLLDIDADKAARVVDAFRAHFEPVGEDDVEADIELEGGEVPELLRMTPNAWHLEPADWERAARLGPVRVAASFVVLRLLRRGST